MLEQRDTAVFIGRFQPLHLAHIASMKEALYYYQKVHIMVGSSFLPRSYKNPFTFEERKGMIESALIASFGNAVKDRLFIHPVVDNLYDDNAWVAQIMAFAGNSEDIALIGLEKDESTYYMKFFPTWNRHPIALKDNIDATLIRDMYFTANPKMRFISGAVHSTTLDFLESFKKTPEFSDIRRERAFIEEYKQQWKSVPYPVTFVTTDAVLVQSGHILLVKRGAFPGKGLYALPGGFLDANKDRSLLDCVLRELKEETCIDLPQRVIRGSLKRSAVFDAIGRSSRGRTITNAFFFQLEDTGTLPKVKGADDAEKAFWLPISQLAPNNMFEDHYSIIKSFV